MTDESDVGIIALIMKQTQLYIVPHDLTFEGDSSLFPDRATAIPFIPDEDEQFALKRLRAHFYEYRLDVDGVDRTPNEDGTPNEEVAWLMQEATSIVGGWVIDGRTLDAVEFVGRNGNDSQAYATNNAIKLMVHAFAVAFIGERFTSSGDVVVEDGEQLPEHGE